MTIINKYFGDLPDNQLDKFDHLQALYQYWNERINLISRKDIEHLYLRHVLHSLAISKFVCFADATTVLDVGTGGGFPGIPLAIVFPKVEFLLIDSTGKKIDAVNEVIKSLQLNNVTAQKIRSEEMKNRFDFVTGRAVTAFPKFVESVSNCLRKGHKTALPNGIIYLKGGDVSAEIKDYTKRVETVEITSYFDEDFFETKKIIYLPF